MKLVSWNVNGLRACVKKGFLDYFKEIDADIFCIQETKLQDGQIELDLDGYYQYWNYALKKAIPEQQFLQNGNHYQSNMDLKRKNMSLKEESLP